MVTKKNEHGNNQRSKEIGVKPCRKGRFAGLIVHRLVCVQRDITAV